MVNFDWPPFGNHRGPWFWLNLANIWHSRRKLFRPDHSNQWRYAHESANPPPLARSGSFDGLITGLPRRFRIAILGDTGEGDASQYALLPLLHGANPDFLIVNGDVAYPAGELDDFHEGFFRPYHGFDKPIWATAGNHEYYSGDNGRTFYQVFCTRACGDWWSRYGLRLVPQPGMYWELRDTARQTPLVIIGLDSGKAGNLDGHNSFFSKLFAGAKQPDTEQHQWLDWRLRVADEDESKVVVLFHIPALVKAQDAGVHLFELHRALARHKSVRAVFCGHIHNHQRYAAATFRQYLIDTYQVPPNPGFGAPEYVVSGNGGATIESTDFHGHYQPLDVYPSLAQWHDYAGLIQRALDRTLPGWPITRLAGQLTNSTEPENDDPPRLQSFLLLDVDGQRIDVSQVYLDDLQRLFTRQPNGTHIRIDDPNPPLDPGALAACTKLLFSL